MSSLSSMGPSYAALLSADPLPGRPTVLIDMDGCLVDWDQGFIGAWGGRSSIDRAASYVMEDCVPEEFRDEAVALFHREGFFASLPPMAQAVDALWEMVASHIQVFICSSPILSSRFCAGEKFHWVEEHLGKEWLPRVILTSDKTLVKGDVLIDDKPSVTGNETTPSWLHIVFDAPYNSDTAHSVRLSSWERWRETLQNVLML